VPKENPIHLQDQALIEAISSQRVERIGILGDETIQLQHAVGGQRAAKEAKQTLLALVIRMRSYVDQAAINSKPESINPSEAGFGHRRSAQGLPPSQPRIDPGRR
jgi:hypothetical protein